MGYKQIDGNKPFLINEFGQVRQELRNLPEDSDRFIYKRDAKGQKKNAWPKLILSADTGNGEDIRLIPELVLKEHGELPRPLPCKADDFEARDGNKLNTAQENIEYVGAANAKAKPYKAAPEKEVEEENEAVETSLQVEPEQEPPPSSENKSKPVPPKPAKQVAKEAREAEKAKVEDPKLPPLPTPNVPDPESDELKSDLQKGSGGLNAKAAIKVINEYDFEELRDAGFYTEDKIDNPRATVQDAWKVAELKWKEEMKQ